MVIPIWFAIPINNWWLLNCFRQQIVQSLQDIDRIRTDMMTKNSDIQVPLEVFEWVIASLVLSFIGIIVLCLDLQLHRRRTQSSVVYQGLHGESAPKEWTGQRQDRLLSGKCATQLVQHWTRLFQRFKAMLLVELSKVFPNEMGKYRAVRGDERSSMWY